MQARLQKFKKKPLVLAIILLLVAGAAFFFIHREIRKNMQVSEENEKAWQTEADRRSELQTLDRALKTVDVERSRLDAHFIKGSEVVPFLDMVEKLGPEVGAKTEVSLVDVIKDNSGLVVDIKVSGKFESVYKFLTLLENSPYELDILVLDIQQFENVDAEGKVLSALWAGVIRLKMLSFVS